MGLINNKRDGNPKKNSFTFQNLRTKPMDIKSYNNKELLLLRIEIERELAFRGIPYSVGEVGEELVINYFCSTPGLPNLINAPIGAKNVDALSRDGDRYSIKTTQKGNKTGTIYPDPGNPDKQLFEFLLVVKLSEDLNLESIHRFSWDKFLEVRAWDKRMNSWYVPTSKKRLEVGECIFSANSVD